ncbi:MAG: type IV secretion system DNA-binding domain-containing protein [Candidatus Shapirobacteria bacterium]|nr:type IV secretion system DNA-binding domain-containing protein [Candidatus Shapirobacteria bacterium]MDD4382639.1 type IV secretion system DNA-binding domain-containing protein [Candidatus Shapirobacteria bacterium]
MTSVDVQQLQLLHQIQQHTLSNTHVFSLYLILSLPLPISWKLTFYNWLTPLISTLSPMWMTIILVVGPILGIISLIILIKIILGIIKTVVPMIFKQFSQKRTGKKMIQLIFPADTSKSAYATEELYTLLHTLSRQVSFRDRITQRKNEYSLEIVSTKNEGIRYLLSADPKFIEIIKHNLLSYLPGIKIKEINDYLDINKINQTTESVRLIELKLSSHFALPLQTQKTLSENDPISYLTGNMTNLKKDELISFQIIVSPIMNVFHQRIMSEIKELRTRLYQGLPLTEVVQKNALQKLVALPGISIIWFFVKGIGKIVHLLFLFVISIIPAIIDTSGKSVPIFQTSSASPKEILNPYEQELARIIKDKIDRSLFETSIRLLVITHKDEENKTRINGLISSLGQLSSPYQSLVSKNYIFNNFKNQIKQFKQKSLSTNSILNQNPILSISELSDLYHFPYNVTTKTEGMVTSHSSELPSPLSVKNNSNFDVVFGKNKYANVVSDIGLTDDDRSRHVYAIGQTGSGKTTIIFHMAKDDIQKGRGVAVIDPHGDLAEDLLYSVPKSRFDDCIYLNPFDISHPIGINLLELKSGLSDDELEQEKELVCESVISVFRRIFSKDENTDSHRIEYILRNTIYTAFTVKDATIFTVYDLLNNPNYQKSITTKLEDANLKNFWLNEFGKAGSYQAVKMVSGVTAKIGRFLFSPTAKRILEQPKSTINFDEIISSGKILICNLAEGKLGEDTSQLLGTTIIAKLQQAFMRRVRTPIINRKPFYLFVDEFQNFATTSFTKLLSGGRKFGLRLTIAEQSTAQQSDRNMVNVILANTGTIICFRTASPIDEELMLDQFSPYVKKGDIGNLPRFRFYMKLSAVEPEEPFSGETIPIVLDRNPERLQKLIEISRKNYAITYKKEIKEMTKVKVKNKIKTAKKPLKKSIKKKEILV